MRVVILLVFLLSAFSAQAIELSKEQKLADYNFLVATIESGYGPLEYKINKGIVKYDKIVAKYHKRIVDSKTNHEFYYLLVQFIAEFKDGHFGASLPTKYESYLPLWTDLIDGKVLISDVTRPKAGEEDNDTTLTEDEFPYVRGDEIVSINGVPTAKVLDDIKKYIGSGYEMSALRSASWSLFHRRASRMPAPKGKIKFSVRRGTSKVIEAVEMEWLHKGEFIDENPDFGNNANILFRRPVKGDRDFFDVSAPFFDEDPMGERSYACSGSTRIAIPEDATVIMMEPFVAYYHPTPKGNVGYLRIPHYMPRNKKTGKAEYELRYEQYLYAIIKLEENTVGLVIDQDHNCGGSVDYLEKLMGLFISRPYSPMIFRMRANKEEYIDYKVWLNENNKHTTWYDNALGVLTLIQESWLKGEYLTAKTSIHGIEELHPNFFTYTKPILMLIDERSGSGGDAFPAMMKGLGRATLLGTRTSGLGGHVEGQPELPFSRMKFRMTKSLFYRPDGVAVENNGATPDIPYTISRDDFMYEYKGYQKFYLEQLLKLIP